jgi:hypothetical protein
MPPPVPTVQDWRGLQPESLLPPHLAGTPPPFQNGRLFAEMGALRFVIELVFFDLPVKRRQPDVEETGRLCFISTSVVEDALDM